MNIADRIEANQKEADELLLAVKNSTLWKSIQQFH